MSTHATLGIKYPDGTISGCYVHYDGHTMETRLKDFVKNFTTTSLAVLIAEAQSAGGIRSFHCGIRDVIIDSNVVRLYGRLFGFEYDGETRRKPWLRELADRITPARIYRDFNYAVIDFTRSICKPRPDCGHCMLNAQCAYYTATCES